MKPFKALIQLSIIESMFPFALSTALYLLGVCLSYFSATQSSHDNDKRCIFTNRDNLLYQLAQDIFGIYGNYFQFISLMFLIRTIAKIKIPKVKDLFQQQSLKTNLTKGFLKRLLIYSLIYCLYQLIGITLIPSLTKTIPHSHLKTHLHVPSRRMLEEEETKEILLPKNEELSLSVGRPLSSLPVDATTTILSHDGKLLYAANFYESYLKIIDVSDVQAPTIRSTIKLVSFSMPKFGAFYLAKDDQTLFATDNHYLQIINVSNPNSPFLIGSCNDTNAFLYSENPYLYKPKIEISKDQKTLFAGGLGLQVFNISDLSNPALISSTLDSAQLPSTSLALSADSTHLLLVNKALQIYDISSDPNRPIPIKNLSTNQPATSLILTHDKKIAYILCRSSDDQVTIEKIDVSNPAQPSRIKQYQPSLASKDSPVIIAISPCDRYIFISLALDYKTFTGLRTFDTVEEKTLSPIKSMIQTADAMIFIPNTSYLISSSSKEENMRFFELFPNFSKRKIFSLTELKIKKYFLKENANSLQFSSDRQAMFLSTGHVYLQGRGTLEIFNASLMTHLSSYSSDQPIFRSFISLDKTKAILQLYSKIEFLDISDLSSPTLIDPPLDFGEVNYISSLLVFKDISTAIVTFSEAEESWQILHIRFFNISDPLHINELALLSLKTSVRDSHMVLSKNEKIMFLFTGRLVIYDLSDLKNPQQLVNLSTVDDGTTQVLSCLLSPDENILAVRTVPDRDDFTKLKFFNVSNPKQPAFLSEITLPQEEWQITFAENSAFSLDQKIIYISQLTSLLSIDISNIKTPKISGIVPNPAFEIDNPVSCLRIEPDGNSANVLTEPGYLYQMSLRLPETLYMKQESFKLGVKYPNTLAILTQNSASEYELLSTENYKLIKTRFINFEVIQRENPVKIISSSLQDWVTLEKENNALTIESTSRNDINSHTFCSGFSSKIPISVFKEIEPKLPNTTDSKDLIATLISMGYLDNQLFITSNFGTLDSFYLPRLYRDLEQDIYQMINDYYQEACTQFEITPSLELEILNNKLSIKTPSTASIKLTIELQPRGRFLSSQPGVRKNSSIITYEDSLKEINLLLHQLVLDLPTSEPCNGIITVNDHLNYPFTKEIVNISKYFFENQQPVMNKKLLLQDQINSFSIFTGQYFIINLNPETFVDNYSDQLSYSLVMNNIERSKIPSWLTFNYPDLKGTPPEDLMDRNFELLMIIENEFKQIEVPFKMRSQISLIFGFKLAIKNSPYILTILGLIVYASKIYNILFKKHYQHKKDYHLKVGEEITPNVIFPVMFIAEEMQEKKIIWKHLVKIMARKMNTSGSPHKYQIVEYFIDEITGDLDKTKVSDVIKEAITEISASEKNKLPLYSTGDGPRKARVFQLLINDLVDWQLNLAQEQETRKIFKELKERCYELVECHNSSVEFTINHLALQQALQIDFSLDQPLNKNSASLSDMEGNLLEEVPKRFNINLLENALISLVFKHQSVNNLDSDVNVTIFRRLAKNFIQNFFKKDLLEISFQSRGKLDYGFDYKITNSVLHFFGTPNISFNRKTVVFQILHRHQRIHKEIWIYGPNDNEKPSVSLSPPISRDSSKNHNEIL